ncbi:MAG: hypothetical protein EOP02_05560 [Proteobacteria bacterium]|nr:MAG: hypothetical protein EOP02_05560 [Pseudomonadota bacterium]
MNDTRTASEYLVISRGQWDAGLPPEEIQQAIDEFYAWLGEMVSEGRMKRGQRLSHHGATVSKHGTVTDGPFGETKEVIGGFWTIVAYSLEEAASLAARNPCLRCGLFYEIRPVDPEDASAFVVTTETPSRN